VLRVNAELLTGMGTQPDAWRALLAAAPAAAGTPGALAGLAVRDQSGFGALLGLKEGDRVTLANGIPLATPDDVLAAVVKPLTANLPVRVSGTREGKPAEWLLLNAGACPG
jgi:S1-C subfamily serine protease